MVFEVWSRHVEAGREVFGEEETFLGKVEANDVEGAMDGVTILITDPDGLEHRGKLRRSYEDRHREDVDANSTIEI